jgi:hypothetical protein
MVVGQTPCRRTFLDMCVWIDLPLCMKLQIILVQNRSNLNLFFLELEFFYLRI